MFESITKTKVASVSDPERKNRMIEALCEAHIKYYIKCKDINHRNLFDTAKIGEMMRKPKFVYDIYVDKEQAEISLHIIHSL